MQKLSIPSGTITVVGLGAGPFEYLTVETLDYLTQATSLYLRTAIHPSVAGLRSRGISFETFDSAYHTGSSFEAVYDSIVAACIAKAQAGEAVVYAVPGSPLVAEQTVVLLRQAAVEANIPLTILPGMSFLEVLYAKLEIDPLAGLAILDGAKLDLNVAASGAALVISQVYNQQIASDVKLSLMDFYPDEHQVIFIRNLGLPDEEIRPIFLYELDRQPVIDHLTSLYVPAIASRQKDFSLTPLVDIMTKLRAQDGCPWDIEQTHSSLRRYMVEEVYEVLEAIDQEDAELLCEELGDLLLQIVFHARVAEESGAFSMQDVIDQVTEKMVRRHPHVFGSISVQDAAEVVLNWDQIKKLEKQGERPSQLDGIPGDLPSLLKAYKLQGKAKKVGFDWPHIDFVWQKVQEELAELKEAVAMGAQQAIEAELGDVLFSLVNLARFLQVEPETALNRTNQKFKSRFQFIEKRLAESQVLWENVTLDELDLLWEEAKKKEKR
ncbi:MAG: nucleoside triphosphate pyrophosphohydrolase [Sporomusaceae bacterium]|nr:nucleoside triphosphate pyrophosphohydrolase [Sporomusaceae bacterium]